MTLPLDEAPWTPSLLTRTARRVVEGNLGAIWVRGEVSDLKVYQSGHCYFALRDAAAQVRCVMWRANASRLKTTPPNGTQVFVFGTPTVWEEKGEFRLTVTQLLATEELGGQQLELERTRAALERDGLLDPARKRPLPEFPARIAVVTSLDGAALRDIVTVARKRWPAVELLVVGSKVQGAEAEADLVRALGLVNRLEPVDVCLLSRGGGSKEDLAVFNREAVCRALAAVKVPTVSAIGHETDTSLTDLVADLRAATPSAAVEIILPDRDELSRHAAGLATRLAQALGRGTRLARERLERTADRLEHLQARALERPRRDLERMAAQLDALSPLRVLERGYSVARGADGRVLRRVSDFPPGAAFRLRVTDGEVHSRVEGGS
ncbi:MAG: exodeoxyribonuclease VII large subunit [Gemmatimonadota bacterium]|nr:exodeoxyribonuclease VII large subunit [Gemmatimonadota bacterium]MDH4348672.1 exodeoxyribonuclease VII large subunit [Gemmatimonadota bacterium]MDH5283440.1 exodeoxyribonuclease VII large subunit [Gemmatimonadota bacterium]